MTCFTIFISLAAVGLATGCGRLDFDEQSDSGEIATSANFVFVTSSAHAPIELGPDLGAADAICAARATEANLPGTYVAWLSTSTRQARDRLAGARGWVRVDGRPVADGSTLGRTDGQGQGSAD
jgi:hypothetical protein